MENLQQIKLLEQQAHRWAEDPKTKPWAEAGLRVVADLRAEVNAGRLKMDQVYDSYVDSMAKLTRQDRETLRKKIQDLRLDEKMKNKGDDVDVV